MQNINHVIEFGRLTRDAELRYTNNGTAVMNFSIAVNDSMKKGDEWVDIAYFFDCVIFGKRAESLAQYMKKGAKVAISGKLKQEHWDKDGQTHSKVSILAEDVELCGDSHAPSSNGGNGGYIPPKAQEAYRQNPPQTGYTPQMSGQGGGGYNPGNYNGNFQSDIPY